MQVGQYILEDRLGHGGMAEVWRVRHVDLGQPAAIKFLSEQYARHEEVQARFYNEARIMFSLRHPNIVAAKDYVKQDGRHFLVMELMTGGTLDDRIEQRQGAPFKLPEVLPLMQGILAGLSHAHTVPSPPNPDDLRPVYHRDVKPSNILFDEAGTPKLADFGIARVMQPDQAGRRRTRTGMGMGTGGYMSPEQMSSAAQVDGRSDLYNVGVVLYELLTGHLPFEEQELLPDFNSPAPPRKWVPGMAPEVEGVILRAIRARPSERFQTAGEMFSALVAAAQASSGGHKIPQVVPPPPLPPPPPVRQAVRPTPGWLIAFAMLVLLGFGGGIGWAVYQEYFANQQADPTEIGAAVSPAAVKISSFDEAGNPLAAGSGFVVEATGTIATNYHLIRGAHRVNILTSKGEELQVRGVLEYDPAQDFALLKVDAYDLPVVPLGDAEILSLAETLVAIGHPGGLSSFATTGLMAGRRTADGYALLQVTAAFPGSSGGPVANQKREIVGMVAASKAGEASQTFALPVNYVAAALRSSTRELKTLASVAQWQRNKDLENFAGHEGKYSAFRALYTKGWSEETEERWTDNDTNFRINTVFAPASAALKEPVGYLSEGIRVSVQLLREGNEWREKTAAEAGPVVAQALISANTGFRQTANGMAALGGEPAYMFEITGQGERISEPERARFFIIARSECRLTAELVAPASKFADYEPAFEVFVKTFEFKKCPQWQK
jgi:serine/threonine protein kinase